ncbi:MAG: hypothetical protein GY874_22385 [Desulfobacteraceae bacterium]|nr:hypothetical protein [Desulfobacteraceae bacterium]
MPLVLRKILIICVLSAAVGASATNLMDRGLDWCAMKYVNQINQRYLDNAFGKALSGFLILSGLKSGLAVIEGSEVGVGFSLELGDVVQPLYDYVDIAWRAALTGGTIIALMQLALAGLDVFDHWVLAIVLFLYALNYALHWYKPDPGKLHRQLQPMLRFGSMLCIALYLLLPLAVTCTAALSKHITQPILEKTHKELKKISEDLAPETLNRRFFGEEVSPDTSIFDLKKRLKNLRQNTRILMSYLKVITEKMASLTLKLIAAYAFDCLVFPLFFGLILTTMIKSGVGYFFGLARPQ